MLLGALQITLPPSSSIHGKAGLVQRRLFEMQTEEQARYHTPAASHNTFATGPPLHVIHDCILQQPHTAAKTTRRKTDRRTPISTETEAD